MFTAGEAEKERHITGAVPFNHDFADGMIWILDGVLLKAVLHVLQRKTILLNVIFPGRSKRRW